MHDAGYVLAGYAATLLMLAGYRWRLAARARRARDVITALGGRDRVPSGRRRS